MSGESNDVLGAKVDNVVKAVDELKAGLSDVNRTLQTLVRVEARQADQAEALARAFKGIDGHEKRIQLIEVTQPALTETRNWVVGGMVVLVGAMIWGALTGHIVAIIPK